MRRVRSLEALRAQERLAFRREHEVGERARARGVRRRFERGDRVDRVGRRSRREGSARTFGAIDGVTSVEYTMPASPAPSAIFVATALTSSSFDTTLRSTRAAKSAGYPLRPFSFANAPRA